MKNLARRILNNVAALITSPEYFKLVDAFIDGVQAAIASRYAMDSARALRILFSNSWRMVRVGVKAFDEAGGVEANKAFKKLEMESQKMLEPTAEDKADMMAWVGMLQLDRFEREALRWKSELTKFRFFVRGAEDDTDSDPDQEHDPNLS